MSTRCQVKVFQTGCSWEQEVMLYHHCDGYPSHMLPDFRKAFAMIYAKDPQYPYQAGRTGAVAAFLCAAHPAGFEPESGMELHGDIEYLYTIELVNEHGGSMAERPYWKVSYVEDGEAIAEVIKP